MTFLDGTIMAINRFFIIVATIFSNATHIQAFTNPNKQRTIQSHKNNILTKPGHKSPAKYNVRSLTATPSTADDEANNDREQFNPLNLHHTAIRTRDIEIAIKFYSLFGFQVETKFRSGPARAAWITNYDHDSDDNIETEVKRKGRIQNTACRLELIEVPAHILQEQDNERKCAINLLQNESLLGLNHYALDVTSYIHRLQPTEYYGLDQFLEHVNSVSLKRFNKTLRVAVKPRQQVIGSQVYELAFLYDADGTLFELIRYIKELKQNVDSGWEPWDGKGFIGIDENDE